MTTSEADMHTEARSSRPSARLVAVARAAGLGLAYAASLTALALPVGVGYFAYQRWIGGQSLQEASLHLEDALLLLQAVAAALGMLAAFVWVRFLLRNVDREGDLRALGMASRPRGWARFALGAAGGAAVAGISIALAFALGDLRLGPSHWQVEGGADVAVDLIGALVAILCSVIGEELVFRGYMTWTLRRAWPAGAAVVWSAILFAGYRALMAPSSTLVLLNTLAAGVVLAGLFRLTGSLHVSIGARLGWAAVIGLVFSLPVAGSPVEGVLYSLPTAGLALGRAFGPEGSWILLALLAVGVALVTAAGLSRRAH